MIHAVNIVTDGWSWRVGAINKQPVLGRAGVARSVLVKKIVPVEFERRGLRLVPLTEDFAAGLTAAIRDGRLWELWYTSVPPSEQVPDSILPPRWPARRSGK